MALFEAFWINTIKHAISWNGLARSQVLYIFEVILKLNRRKPKPNIDVGLNGDPDVCQVFMFGWSSFGWNGGEDN